MKTLSRLAFLVAAALAASSAPALSSELAWYSGAWAQEKSDLAADPAVTFGRLPNGFRYAVIPSRNPAGRVTAYLDVQAGSLMEEEAEQGFAHYIEHMAFNGTKRFPEGKLIPFFQANGMGFGGDTNAHTTLHETVYKLNLAKNTPEAIKEGLTVLRDFADGIVFEDGAVTRERGVILSEKTSRENEQVLAGREWRKFLFGTSRLSHDTIGKQETLDSADAAKLRHFYEKWYVPGRMILVIAGDTTAKAAEPLVREAFSSMKAKALPELESFGTKEEKGPRAFVLKRGTSSVSVMVNFQHPRVFLSDSRAKLKEYYIDSIAQIAMQRRLLAVKEAKEGIWTQGRARISWRQGISPAVMLSASTSPAKWKDALTELHSVMASARAFGLTDDEIAQGKQDLERRLTRQVKQISSWTNESWAKAFVDNANMNRVFTSPEEDLKQFRSISGSITAADIAEALKKMFSVPSVAIGVSGKTDATEAGVLQYWNELESRKAQAASGGADVPFPYLALPQPAAAPAFAGKTLVGLKGNETAFEAALPSGVKLVLLPLHREKGTVRATLIYGSGLQGQTDRTASVAKLAYRVLAENGVGKLTRFQTSRALSSKGIGVAEKLAERCGFIEGEAPSADYALLLQAVWTQFRDPTVTAANRRRVIASLREAAFEQKETVDGVSKTEITNFMTGNRLRGKPLDADEADTISLQALQAYLKRTRAAGPVTLVVSGDFPKEKLAAEAARLFTPVKKASPADRKGVAPSFPAGVKKVIDLPKEKVDKAIAVKAWNLDLKDPSDRKALALRGLAASVLRDRLREELREKLGVAYSPSALYRTRVDDDGFGTLILRTQTQTGHADEVLAVYEALPKTMASSPVTEAELSRIRKPLETGLSTSFQTDKVWHTRLVSAEASRIPLFDWTVAYAKELSAAKASEVNAEMAKLFAAPACTLVIEKGKAK